MLTSEVLNKAADEIERRGWTTGGFGDPWGMDDGTSPICLEGGIIAAAGIREAGHGLLANCPAARAVHTYLDLRDSKPLWSWNDDWVWAADGDDDEDHPAHTQAEVIEVLRAAAAIEQAREAQPAVVTAAAWTLRDDR